MEVYKAVFDIENNLISKTKCNLDDVFGGENFDYQDYWCADDLHILKDNLNEGIYFLIDNIKREYTVVDDDDLKDKYKSKI